LKWLDKDEANNSNSEMPRKVGVDEIKHQDFVGRDLQTPESRINWRITKTVNNHQL